MSTPGMVPVLRWTALLALALLTPPSFARTWHINPDGTGDAPTIQAAVDSAAAGDVVLLEAGVFLEQVALKSDLTLRSLTGPTATSIDAAGQRLYCIYTAGSVDNVTVEGIRFTGVGRAAIVLGGTNILFRDCIIEDNTGGTGTLSTHGSTRILDCVFRRNSALAGADDPSAGTLVLSELGSVHLEGCSFDDNNGTVIEAWGAGSSMVRCQVRGNWAYGTPLLIAVWSTFDLRATLFEGNSGELLFGGRWGAPAALLSATRNTFVGNHGLFEEPMDLTDGSAFHANVFTEAGVGFTMPTGLVSVTCNDSWGNGTDWAGLDPTIGGNFSADPLFCDPDAGDYHLQWGSPCLPANSPDDCGLIGAYGFGGCNSISVTPESWAQVKARYR
ncbi:MAG: hypothetical protein DHS20C21_10470 [Gemmatimonadota bacterium]|nr:MAG: hypothetical protein DHS20C21_10470 [Gemmatimonadota bacterium]